MQEIKVDDDFNNVHLGPLLVVNVSIKGETLQCAWADTWVDGTGL